ncbi:MAG: hypothetical protein KME40_18900 [Komarekiella atlantica HA4396-MV6]|nr:hypothetical protein [Komarekiella atlantica HA4396-MV6]
MIITNITKILVKPDAFRPEVEMIQKAFIQENDNERMEPEMQNLLPEL